MLAASAYILLAHILLGLRHRPIKRAETSVTEWTLCSEAVSQWLRLSYQAKQNLGEPDSFVLQRNCTTVFSRPNTWKHSLETMIMVLSDVMWAILKNLVRPLLHNIVNTVLPLITSLRAITLKANDSQYPRHAFICCFMSVFLSFVWVQWEFLSSSWASYEQKKCQSGS